MSIDYIYAHFIYKNKNSYRVTAFKYIFSVFYNYGCKIGREYIRNILTQKYLKDYNLNESKSYL